MLYINITRKLSRSMCMGMAKMNVQKFTVDFKKPLVHQVGHLGEEYQRWVHQPIITKKPLRLFESDLIELLTRAVWWTVPVIWVPVALLCLFMSYEMGHSLLEVASMLVLGIFSWSFLEHIFHRFLLHIETRTYWGNTVHFVVHGFHHKYPMDPLRLVVPPAATALIAILVWNMARLVSTPSTTPGLFGGMLLGYVIYDLTHYYLHYAQPTMQLARNLKKNHMSHHFRIQNKGFGVTSSLWDWVFGTLPPHPNV